MARSLFVLFALLVSARAFFAPSILSVHSTRDKVVTFNMVPLTHKGKRVEVAAGSSMMAACTKLGMKVPTNCKKVTNRAMIIIYSKRVMISGIDDLTPFLFLG